MIDGFAGKVLNEPSVKAVKEVKASGGSGNRKRKIGS
jgi:hypothetical protein